MKLLTPTMLSIALASCGAAKEGKTMNDDTTIAQFAIRSADIADGQPIPDVHGCDGADRSPALSWDEPPEGTRSFALVMDDPDAPNGTFRHWGAYDIPASTRSIPSGESVGEQATNDFGKTGYGGPCPPKGHGPHHYRFKLYALDVAKLDVPPEAKVKDVEDAAQQHQVAIARLTGTFERQ